MKRMHIITQTKQKHSLIHSLVLARGEQEEKKGQQTWHSAGVGPSPWYPACTCTWMGQTPFSVSVALVCVCDWAREEAKWRREASNEEDEAIEGFCSSCLAFGFWLLQRRVGGG